MVIKPELKKIVAFLGVQSTKDPNGIHWGGTAFFVFHPGPRQKLPFLYLVTARHVVDQLKKLGEFYIRTNAKKGEAFIIKCDDGANWQLHPEDQSADVAVLPIPLIQELMDQMDISPLPTPCFFNEADRMKTGIGEGSEIIIMGLFSKHAGKAKNMPLIRSGNVAMFPEERIPVTDFGDMEAYVIEARSIGGLSGSPVFVIQVAPLQLTLHLLGLIQGHWDVSRDSMIDVTSQDAGSQARVNMGVAIVTPAKKILEVLNCQALASIREQVEKQWIEQNSPTPDLPVTFPSPPAGLPLPNRQ
jgi:hypothetical protein